MLETQPNDLSANLAGLNIQGPAGAPSHATSTQVRRLPAILKLPSELLYEITDEVLCNKYADRSAEDVRQGQQALLNLVLACKGMERACMRELMRQVTLRSPGQALNFLRGLVRRQYLCGYVKMIQMLTPGNKTVRYSDKAKADIVRSDPVAARLLGQGVSWIPTVVLARVLKQLPNLRALRVPSLALYSMLRWPPHERMEGTSIVHLELGLTNEDEMTGIPSNGLLDWSKAFRPGQEPKDLQRLVHACQVSLREIPREWFTITASLMSLKIIDFPTRRLASAVQHFHDLEELVFCDLSGPLLGICSQLDACSNLARTLKYLEVHVAQHQQVTGLDGCMVYNSFAHFSKLESLQLPILVKMQKRTASPMTLPTRLKTLTLYHIEHKGVPNWGGRFLAFFREAIEATRTPASLRRIIIVWPANIDKMVSPGMLSSVPQELRAIAEACTSKGIVLLHHLYPDVPVSSEHLIHLLRRQSLPGFVLLNDDDEM